MLTVPVQPVDDRLKQKRLDFDHVDASRHRGRADGRRRRDSAHQLLIAHRSPYINSVSRALVEVLLDEGDNTIDPVHERVKLPESINPKCFGAVPKILMSAGLIVSVGMRPSRRPEAHGRKVEIWRLIDRSAALDWLAAHPEMLPANESGVA